jgi:hypothetical protein
VFVVEENLIAIGADVRRETGNDVFKTDPQLNEWMQRVRKLGGTTDIDDDERAKRLEEVPHPPPLYFMLSTEIDFTIRKFLHRGKRDRNDGLVYLCLLYSFDAIERKRSLSPLKDSPRSITSGPKSPTHSVFSKETRDSDDSPTTAATTVSALMGLC